MDVQTQGQPDNEIPGRLPVHIARAGGASGALFGAPVHGRQRSRSYRGDVRALSGSDLWPSTPIGADADSESNDLSELVR